MGNGVKNSKKNGGLPQVLTTDNTVKDLTTAIWEQISGEEVTDRTSYGIESYFNGISNKQSLTVSNAGINFGFIDELEETSNVSLVSEIQTGLNAKVKIQDLAGVEKNMMLIRVADNYASDALASAGGIPIGGAYHTGGVVKIRLT